MQIQEYLKDKKHYSFEGVHNTKDFHFARFEIFNPGNTYHEHIIFNRNLEITYIADKDIMWMTEDYSTNCFKIEKNNLWGIIDAYGNEIIPVKYKDIQLDAEEYEVATQDGLMLLKTTDDKQILFTKKGKQLSKPYDYIETYIFDGMFIIKNDKKYGVINKDGVELIKPEYEHLDYLGADFEPVKYIYAGERWTSYQVLNLKGEVILPQKYKRIIYLGNNKFFCETLDHEFVVKSIL